MSASKTSPNDSLNLTFGIEIECVIKVSEAQLALIQSNPHSNSLSHVPDDEDMVHEEIYHRLVNNGIPCFQPGESTRRRYDCWKIDTDPTISLERPAGDDGHAYFQMELVSRILQPTQDGFKEIEKVLDLIKSMFILKTNISTGLHVHVGNQRDGFPLHTLKQFALAVVAFEQIIHSIHPDNRIDRDSWWCRPITSGPELTLLPHFERLFKIEKCKDMWAVIDVMNPYSRREYAYNFQNLAGKDYGDIQCFIQTIEFRQHAGSCDAEEISSWVDFVTGLIHYCHLAPRTPHLVLCLSKSLDPSFTVLDLMKVIDRSSLVDFYKSRLHLRARPGLDEKDHECAAMFAGFFEGFTWDHRTVEEINEDQG